MMFGLFPLLPLRIRVAAAVDVFLRCRRHAPTDGGREVWPRAAQHAVPAAREARIVARQHRERGRERGLTDEVLRDGHCPLEV